MTTSTSKRDYAAELGALGYPKFAYLKGTTTPDPAELLLDALNEPDLNSRIVEALPWLVLNYRDLDWGWLSENAKLHRRPNRLGFVVSVASELAQRKNVAYGSEVPLQAGRSREGNCRCRVP